MFSRLIVTRLVTTHLVEHDVDENENGEARRDSGAILVVDELVIVFGLSEVADEMHGFCCRLASWIGELTLLNSTVSVLCNEVLD